MTGGAAYYLCRRQTAVQLFRISELDNSVRKKTDFFFVIFLDTEQLHTDGKGMCDDFNNA